MYCTRLSVTLQAIMKIVVDDKIPYIHEKLEMLADEVVSLRGADIKAEDVKDADALIVRTRTRCDEQLLSGSKVQLVATATIGFDHIDTDYMQRAGIAWTNCPGCNAASVAQYVECSLLLLEQQKGLCLKQSTIGIVGCGHVGSKVKAVAERLGMHVLVCDPLADEAFFHRLARVPYIINTSRGEVVDNEALLKSLQEGRVRDAVIDVWEGEPHLNEQLLERVFIGTPHIAGYSADGKVNADNMVVDALCRHFQLPYPGKIVAPSLSEGFVYTGNPLELYNPLEDSRMLKKEPRKFETLRNNYPLRREKFDR